MVHGGLRGGQGISTDGSKEVAHSQSLQRGHVQTWTLKWRRNAIRNAINLLKRSSLRTFESFEKYHCVAYSVAGGRDSGIPPEQMEDKMKFHLAAHSFTA